MTKTIHPLRAAGLAALAATALGIAPALAHGVPEEIAAAESAAFAEADANGDGVLDAAEFAAFGEALRAKLDALRFAKVDADDSGTVTLEEIQDGRPRGRGHGRGPRP